MAGYSIPGVEALLGVDNIVAAVVEDSIHLGVVGVGTVLGGIALGGIVLEGIVLGGIVVEEGM